MNTTFIYQNTQLPGFLQFPEFLLRVPISQTAKTVYLVLYDRARLSMRNEWTDEFGRVFVIYPITELADRIGKSESTVKAGMKELCQAGLLLKRPGGFPSQTICTLSMPWKVRFQTGWESRLPQGQKTVFHRAGFLTFRRAVFRLLIK